MSPQETDNISVPSSSSIDRVNIRTKPSPKLSNLTPMSPSQQAIQNDLNSASRVQMESIDSLPWSQFRIKDSIPRSPAPMPESMSPAGIAIDLTDVDKKTDIKDDLSQNNDNNSNTSLTTIGSLKIEIDMSVKGDKNPTEYRRNLKGTFTIIILLIISLHLFIEHLNMFTYVINFDYPEVVVATILYMLSTVFILVILAGTLMVPMLSVEEEKFKIFYCPILVAGGIDLIGILVGGSIFGPLSIHTIDLNYSMTYTQLASILTILLNLTLYFLFTRTSQGSPIIFEFMHPFEKVKNKSESGGSIHDDDKESVNLEV